MRDKIILAMPVAVVLFVALSYYLLNNAMTATLPPVSFTVNNSTFAFSSYALNSTTQHQGLMNNTNVTNSTFMLFVFSGPAQSYAFWMMDTPEPLDMIWLNAQNSTARIVYIVNNAPPCGSYSPNQTNCIIYTPKNSANYVLETKSGFAKKNNLTIGESVKFNYK